MVSAARRLRTRWLLHRGVVPARRWWPPLWSAIGTIATWVLAGCLVFWVIRAALTVGRGGAWNWPWSLDPDSTCRASSYSCGVLNSAVLPVLTLALTTVVFLTWRMRSVRWFYTRRAKREPRALVETAGSIMGGVVGRDQLCNALMDNLRDGTTRRPHVLVGAMGTGKTAVLVRLTELLARRGAFPVPIRLRDAQDFLDFDAMANRRFRSLVESRTRSTAEAEKIWRLLRRHDKIVVLADGLEEALCGKAVESDRDNMIRKAIRAAGETRLPLVITSRPHDPLRAMEAAVTELEPLSEESALEYVAAGGGWRSDRQRLDRIVEVANVTDSPLYLQIAKDLQQNGLLERVWVNDHSTGTGNQDSWDLKFDLLETWVDALVDGDLHPELPIDRDERQMTVEYLSALACIGLRSDSSEVSFCELEPRRKSAGATGSETPEEPYPLIAEQLRARRRHTSLDVRLAATWGTRMGLVNECGEALRFQHSIMQAYLGSRYVGLVLPKSVPPPAGEEASPDPGYFPAALYSPGREILIALIFHSRSLRESAVCTCPAEPAVDPQCPVVIMRELLTRAAHAALDPDAAPRPGAAPSVGGEVGSPHSKALEMYGAALDIDSADRHPDPRAITRQICDRWNVLRERDPQQLRAAKMTLVRRAGAASRRAALNGGSPAYEALFDIARRELNYRVRITIAQEIGAGGDMAYRELRGHLHTPGETVTAAEPVEGALRPEVGRLPETGGERERRKHDRAARAAREQAEQEHEKEESATEAGSYYRYTMCARLIPLLVDSVSMTHHQDTPYADLEEWVSRLTGSPGGGDGPDRVGRRGLEVALAHGFKHAANRRLRPPDRGQAREFLAEQAWEILKSTRFWFTRLTLLHALTLWALPDDVTQRQPEHGHGADPEEQVRGWLQLPPGEQEHPLVRAAGKLAVRALQTRRPERFLWIDEAGVAHQVGSETGTTDEPPQHNLWIPPSAGWSTLDPDAQQLLADVTLLMVLTERADRPRDLFRRLERDRRITPRLPPCLSRDRSTLDPTRTIAHAVSSDPGSNCADGCPFELCPCPPKIPDLRVELSEVFCMNQRSLLRRWQPRSWLHLRWRRKARWQRRTPIAELRQFWDQMGDRARDMPPSKTDPARRLFRW